MTVDQGLQRIEKAVERARVANSFRVSGILQLDGPVVSWEGFVAAGNEQYVIETNGLTIDSRRVDGVGWARRSDVHGAWRRVPPDRPVSLAALLDGSDVHSRRRDDDWVVTLRFDDEDVLAALSHIPSTGPTTAEVTLSDDVISDVVLDLDGAARAHIVFWDYGAPLEVGPVVAS